MISICQVKYYMNCHEHFYVPKSLRTPSQDLSTDTQWSKRWLQDLSFYKLLCSCQSKLCLTNFLDRKIKSAFLQRKIILPSSKSEKTCLSWTFSERAKGNQLVNENTGQNECPQELFLRRLLVNSVLRTQCFLQEPHSAWPGPPFSTEQTPLLSTLPHAFSWQVWFSITWRPNCHV